MRTLFNSFRSPPAILIASFGSALYFRNMFGAKAEKALSVFVALSALGNVLSVLFSLGRSTSLLSYSFSSLVEGLHMSAPHLVNQELGRRGIIPFPRFFASSKPFNSPSAGLALQWLMCIIVIVAPPPGDAFNFVLNRRSPLGRTPSPDSI